MSGTLSQHDRRKSTLFLCLVGTIIMQSCITFGTSNPPQQTSSNTPTPYPSATMVSTKTATPAFTPTLGTRSAWRSSRIVFASNRTGNFQIYLMKPDGSELVQLTDAKGDSLSPIWSADAKHIFFVSTRDGNSEIYMMNPDGTDQKNITHHSSNDLLPVWLPHDKIAFVSDRKGRERIFVMNVDGTDIRSFPQSSIDFTSRMVCLIWLQEAQVFLTTEESGRRTTRVLDTANGDIWTPEVLHSQSERSCPLVSNLVSNPWILFVSNRDGHDEIYEFNSQNGTEVQLTRDSESSLGASRSMDEGWITFYSKRSGNWDIYLMGTAGKNLWNITNDPADDIQPAWEPY